MPAEATVRGWAQRGHDGFEAKYRQARLLQLDAWADEIIDIADQANLDPRDRHVRVDTEMADVETGAAPLWRPTALSRQGGRPQ